MVLLNRNRDLYVPETGITSPCPDRQRPSKHDISPDLNFYCIQMGLSSPGAPVWLVWGFVFYLFLILIQKPFDSTMFIVLSQHGDYSSI
jgi:hypothetical protein